MTLLQFASGIMAISGIIWVSFQAASSAASPAFKQDLGIRITSFSFSAALRQWPDEAFRLFCAVFGRKPISLKFLLRSVLLSVGLFVFVSGGYIAISPDYTFEVFWKWNWSTSSPAFRSHSILINIGADYLSLVETFLVLALMRKIGNRVTIPLLLAIDLLLTTAIFFFWKAFLQIGVRTAIEGSGPNFLSLLLDPIYINLFTSLPSDASPLKGMVYFSFYTTFFTSVWIWFYALALLLASFGEGWGGHIWVFFRDRFLNVKDNAITSLGFMACLIFIFGSLIALPVLAFFEVFS